jgi:ATP-dependent Clp protease ATP-binding subunit ClpC
VLFIDEVHTLVGAGAAEGAVDAATILKPALARGELQCVGATTLDDYRKYIERDAALERRFQPVMVEEPSVEETIEILKGIKERYEEHHKVEITESAIKAAAELSSRYVSDRFLPDKAIDLVDEAASRVRIPRSMSPPSLSDATKALERIRKEKEAAIGGQQYEYAAELRERELKLTEKIENLEKGWQEEQEGGDQLEVQEEDIQEVVSMWTGIPVTRLATTETARLLKMEEALHNRIVGQEEAIVAVSRAVRRHARVSRTPNVPSAASSSSDPPESGKRSWHERWLSSCSAATMP